MYTYQYEYPMVHHHVPLSDVHQKQIQLPSSSLLGTLHKLFSYFVAVPVLLMSMVSSPKPQNGSMSNIYNT